MIHHWCTNRVLPLIFFRACNNLGLYYILPYHVDGALLQTTANDRYLSGNFAPIDQTLPLTPCTYTGRLPDELAGGQYVRNGGNPVTNGQLGRDAHWFDGDGMLAGVLFERHTRNGIRPTFVNQYILTDLYLASRVSSTIRTPILPSIATLVNPLGTLIGVILRVFRTLLLIILSRLPGAPQAIRKISVANTALYYHDGRALATCESGPPMRIALPQLDTIGWFDGQASQGEDHPDKDHDTFGGPGLVGFMREWTTAHPRVDPQTGEMLLFHSTFVPPYVRYSIIPGRNPDHDPAIYEKSLPMLNRAIPGIESPRMMHDFAVSARYTIIMDLPLSLNPLNLARGKPVVAYDPTVQSRFGVFPRHHPEEVRWYSTKACCIFHTANCWEEDECVHMLACRLTSASLVFNAGDLAAPQPLHQVPEQDFEVEQCRLYFYQFDLKHGIRHQWALAAIPFEFPSVRPSVSMSRAEYVYGCSVSEGSFGAALGRAVKIKSLVKMHVTELIRRGHRQSPEQVRGCVDTRTMQQIATSTDPDDPVQVFMMPEGWCAQEPRFVARKDGTREDDGWILTYVFDETTQLGPDDECVADAKSELWIIDAISMRHVIARVHLPQRVPYGLHGTWFTEHDVQNQRPYKRVRGYPRIQPQPTSLGDRVWYKLRHFIELKLG